MVCSEHPAATYGKDYFAKKWPPKGERLFLTCSTPHVEYLPGNT